MAAGSSMQAAPMPATRTQARAAQVAASLAAINRRSRPLPAPCHAEYRGAYAKFALHTMHAHRLWIKLWITLGQPEENSSRPEGNAGVTPWDTSAAHSPHSPSATGSHSRCAWSQQALAGRIDVIPGIHRPYDDYQSCNDRHIHNKVGDRPAPARCSNPAGCGPARSGATPARDCDEISDEIRRATGEDRP
jgi:hypothetical protein